jgi:hypothetical protein
MGLNGDGPPGHSELQQSAGDLTGFMLVRPWQIPGRGGATAANNLPGVSLDPLRPTAPLGRGRERGRFGLVKMCVSMTHESTNNGEWYLLTAPLICSARPNCLLL